jgi:hypothetical protein
MSPRKRRFCTVQCQKAHYRRTVMGCAVTERPDGQDYEDMVSLRKQGLSYGEIGEHFGITAGSAWRIVTQRMETWLPSTEHVCAWCGKRFKARADAKYCSAGHRTQASQRRRRRSRQMATVIAGALERAIRRRRHYQLTGQWLTEQRGVHEHGRSQGAGRSTGRSASGAHGADSARTPNQHAAAGDFAGGVSGSDGRAGQQCGRLGARQTAGYQTADLSGIVLSVGATTTRELVLP